MSTIKHADIIIRPEDSQEETPPGYHRHIPASVVEIDSTVGSGGGDPRSTSDPTLQDHAEEQEPKK